MVGGGEYNTHKYTIYNCWPKTTLFQSYIYNLNPTLIEQHLSVLSLNMLSFIS